MFYGVPYLKKQGQNFLKYYKESGYITGQSINF